MFSTLKGYFQLKRKKFSQHILCVPEGFPHKYKRCELKANQDLQIKE